MLRKLLFETFNDEILNGSIPSLPLIICSVHSRVLYCTVLYCNLLSCNVLGTVSPFII